MRARVCLDTPIGALAIETDDAVRSVWFVDDESASSAPGGEAVEQLREYFLGARQTFDVELALEGTAFQLAVWAEVATIPYGAVRSYLDIAIALGDRNLVRAVGAANGANPVSIIIPCHRVVGSDGSLTGYAGGLARKRWLLDLESAQTSLPL